jgi:hypothetical protein
VKLYVVQAAQGEHDEKSWWMVAAWSSQPLADKDATRLNWCARQLRAALGADPMPKENDDDLYTAWRQRRDRLLNKWRALSGDKNLEEYDQPTYSVAVIRLSKPRKQHHRRTAP